MTYVQRWILVFPCLACTTDLGDVGSSTQGATEVTTSGATDTGGSDDGDQTSGSPATGGATAVSSTGASTGDASTGFLTSAEGGSESSGETATTSVDTGGTVDDCSACVDGEVCVTDVAFVTTHHCEPLPQACLGLQFGCECGSELCIDPFSSCVDAPGPTPEITCECPNC